uniref:Uncharacterized protein n=1 Tax=Mandrillus leucophaeus TaxID=9568 RepID=A0A2K5XTI4_MANLE
MPILKENFSFLRIFWAVGRARKFKPRHWGFPLAMLITCEGKKQFYFLPSCGGDNSCLDQSYKNVWKIMWLMFG